MIETNFQERVRSLFPEVSDSELAALERFRELVILENKTQNLTRLVGEQDFVEGHLVDCFELIRSGLMGVICMDLGSGAGVPGIPCALLESREWVLCDSEVRKAEFLSRTVEELGLTSTVRVFAGRAEKWLSDQSVDTIVVRAVGPVSRILGWIGQCSTWNKLLLLKGKGWDEEWNAEESFLARKRLKITGQHDYVVGQERKQRTIIQLTRVSR